MRIDGSGRLLVGTSSSLSGLLVDVASTGNEAGSSFSRFATNSLSAAAIQLRKSNTTTLGINTLVDDDDVLGYIQFQGADGSNYRQGAQIRAEVDGTPGANDMPGRLVFSTTADGASSPTERMRISAAGATKMTTTNSYLNVSKGNIHEMRVSNVDDWTCYLTNIASSQPFGLSIRYPNSAPNSTTDDGIRFEDSSAVRFRVLSNGGIANFQSNDSNLCDEREKKNIETLESTWDSLKNWELKKFHYKESADTDNKIYGVIAQQVKEHCPEVITDWVKQKASDAVLDEEGNVVTPAAEEIIRLGVKEQQMMWMAVKALQESQKRIETLEAKVAALEAG